MSEIAPDDPLWLRRYREEYLTLDEVGRLEGITREGVRQRLKGLGIKPRTLAETKRLQERRATSPRAEDIRQAFLHTRNIAEVAEHIELPLQWVRNCVEEKVPDYEVLERAPRSASKRYSKEDLIASLREAASSSSGNLTAVAYENFVQTHKTLADGRPRPGKQTMALRYGSWRAALEAAELPANPPSGPQKEFDEAAAVDAVVRCWRATGRPPTSNSYDEWQRGHEGLPSAATVRKLTGSWNVLLVRAWQVVHGVELDQDMEDAAVPETLLRAKLEPPVPGAFVSYCTANENTNISSTEITEFGYLELERSVRSHAIIQNAVAKAAIGVGLTPWSPAFDGPAFDVALSYSGMCVFVVEVKSATVENFEFQMRIGLGQVLRYAQRLGSDEYRVIPVIAVEICPDNSWVSLCKELGVGMLVGDSISMDLEKLVEDTIGAV